MHGDISNQTGITIGFRCVGFLIEYKDSKLSDRIANFFVGKTQRAEVNETVKSLMEYFYRETEYTVDLVIETKDYTPDMKDFLDDLCPWNRIVKYDKPSQISGRLLTGDLSYYVDNDPERISLMNNSHAVLLEDLGRYVKVRG